MDILGHILPDELIIGIGPLLMEFNQESTEYQLYGKRRYVFDLHLTPRTTRIYSDYFFVNENQEEKNRMKEWNEKYHSVRQRIAKLIGEETDEYKIHLETVDKLYTGTTLLFSSLMKDVTPRYPVPDLSHSVDLMAQRITANLLEFKNLASK